MFVCTRIGVNVSRAAADVPIFNSEGRLDVETTLLRHCIVAVFYV